MIDRERSEIDPVAVERALARLPRLEREAFLLKARDKLTYLAVGSRLRISANEAEACVVRALVTLDARLRRSERPWWRFW